MYKIYLKGDNNIRRRVDIIKILNNMLWMGAGVGATLLYKKYNRQVMNMIKKKKRQINSSS